MEEAEIIGIRESLGKQSRSDPPPVARYERHSELGPACMNETRLPTLTLLIGKLLGGMGLREL